MAEKAKNKKWTWTDRKYNVLLFLASVLSPWLMIMFLYTHNPTPPSGMAYVTIACVMVGYMAAWLIAAKLLRSTIAATFLCFFATIHLWVFYRVFELLPQGNRIVLTLIKLAIFALIIGLLVFAGRKLQPKLQTAAPVILIAAGAVLVMNLIPVCERMWLKMSVPGFTTETQEFYENKTYTVDETLASPNIYWIHCDGMLGFSSVEKYFDDEQTVFKQELSDRGFAINETASFEALHRTGFAVNVLMNPAWYDEALQEELLRGVPVMDKDLAELNEFLTARWQALRIGIDNNELAAAFMQKKYTVTTAQTNMTIVLPTDVQRVYQDQYLYEGVHFSSPYITDFEGAFSGVLVQLEVMLQKLLMPTGTEIPSTNLQCARYTTMFNQISDDLRNKSEQGQLSLIFSLGAHDPYMYDKDGNLIQGDLLAIENYLGTHQYAAKITMDAVDMILEADPNAILVLQADHGIHEHTKADIHEQLGADAVPEEIWNQVLSAVRVPEQYQNEDFHYAMEDPRNISRWLINSFVGEQYEYLT